jgi:hypothetical protein
MCVSPSAAVLPPGRSIAFSPAAAALAFVSPVGCGNAVSCCEAVFVDKSAKAISTLDVV